MHVYIYIYIYIYICIARRREKVNGQDQGLRFGQHLPVHPFCRHG